MQIRKYQSFASLAFVRGIRRGPVNSPHKRPVTRKMFPFDDVIMRTAAMPSVVEIMAQNHQSGIWFISEPHFLYELSTHIKQYLCHYMYNDVTVKATQITGHSSVCSLVGLGWDGYLEGMDSEQSSKYTLTAHPFNDVIMWHFRMEMIGNDSRIPTHWYETRIVCFDQQKQSHSTPPLDLKLV